jgi:hypothetical protein
MKTLGSTWGRPPGLRGSPWTRLATAAEGLRKHPRSAGGPTADEGVRPTTYAGGKLSDIGL